MEKGGEFYQSEREWKRKEREIWERSRKQSRGRDRENMILLQYVDEWASSSWSFGGFLLREKGGKRVLVGYYRQTYYGRPSGHPSVCSQRSERHQNQNSFSMDSSV